MSLNLLSEWVIYLRGSSYPASARFVTAHAPVPSRHVEMAPSSLADTIVSLFSHTMSFTGARCACSSAQPADDTRAGRTMGRWKHGERERTEEEEGGGKKREEGERGYKPG